MAFIDGFVAPVRAPDREIFTDYARKAAELFRDFGATRIVDTWGDDVPDGKVTDFRRSIQATEGEIVSFGWVEYPDRATRDAANGKLMSDPRMGELGAMPFDGKRMIFGGFETVVDEGAGGTPGYVDGFLGAVPTRNRDSFIAHAAKAAPLFLRGGALRVVECWGADVPRGHTTDFYRAVEAEDDESLFFSWIEWPDKTIRDAAMKDLEAEMMESMKDNPMPFDGKRVVFGGFAIVSDQRG